MSLLSKKISFLKDLNSIMRREMMSLTHASHIGIESCLRRARETMYWPRMVSELKEYISKCDICMAHRSMPGKEPLMLHHDRGSRPLWWCRTDFTCRMWYYSSYIELEHISRATTGTVTKALRTMFSRYDVLISDNGPQFASELFAKFARKWCFDHVTSSPHYPQSNGKAENAVKTVKVQRVWVLRVHSFVGLEKTHQQKDWVLVQLNGSLAARCKTLYFQLWGSASTSIPHRWDSHAINRQKQRQQQYYDVHSKKLWGEKTFVRNRRQLIKSDKLVVEDTPEIKGSPRENIEI